MSVSSRKTRKQELDRQRTEWRRTHRTLNGRIILYPEKPPEHVNARASKTYNWFWERILLENELQDIPGIISTLKDHLKNEDDASRIRMFRTMIGMAEDAYQLKRLEGIREYDTELKLGKDPIFNSEDGVVYRNGKLFTMDYNEDESSILVRDVEGLLVDMLQSDGSFDTSKITIGETQESPQ